MPGEGLEFEQRFQRVLSEQQLVGVLEQLFDADQEAHGFAAVDDPVVIADGLIHHGANDYLSIHGNWPLFDLVHA